MRTFPAVCLGASKRRPRAPRLECSIEGRVLTVPKAIAPARGAALDVLRAVREGAFADHAFERIADALSEADRRLTQELAYGVLRLRGRLDYVIDRLVRGGRRSLKPGTLDALRLGAYQLLELDRVPAYAAVSEAVEAAKAEGGKGAAALTNAVLRRLGRESYGSVTFPSRDQDPAGYLTAWGSHPRWMIDRWLERWPLADVGRLVDYNNRRPQVYLSVLGDRDGAVERLRAAGLQAEPAVLSGMSVLVESASVRQALDLVPAVVQDPGAAAVVEYAAPPAPGCRIADLCAAPGGKAALLAARGHEVWALEASPVRMTKLAENRSRLGLARLHPTLADSLRPPIRSADLVLVDAPCSGSGTLARNPDLRWRLGAADLPALAEVQRRLIAAAADLVEIGGYLVYATCSLEPEENEAQVKDFLARRRDFVAAPPPTSAVSAELVGPDGDLRVVPHHHGVDGAYAARLQRRSA